MTWDKPTNKSAPTAASPFTSATPRQKRNMCAISRAAAMKSPCPERKSRKKAEAAEEAALEKPAEGAAVQQAPEEAPTKKATRKTAKKTAAGEEAAPKKDGKRQKRQLKRRRRPKRPPGPKDHKGCQGGRTDRSGEGNRRMMQATVVGAGLAGSESGLAAGPARRVAVTLWR